MPTATASTTPSSARWGPIREVGTATGSWGQTAPASSNRIWDTGAPPSDAVDADESGGAVVSFDRKHGARSNPLLKLYEEEMTLEVFTPLQSERVTLTLRSEGKVEDSGGD